MRRTSFQVGVACALVACALDQATKALVLAFAPTLSRGLEILPVLNLVLVRNRGVSFGMLGTVPWWVLSLIGSVIVAVIAVGLWRTQSRMIGTALGLIIGGALGNLLDRVRHGTVTDFLDFYLGAYHWPAFNVADAAVVSGVGLLILHSSAWHKARKGHACLR